MRNTPPRRARPAGRVLIAAALFPCLPQAAEPPSPPPGVPAAQVTAPTEAPAPPPTREEAHASFRAAFDARDHAAAAERARLVVEMTERDTHASPEELQVALMNLGLAEQLAGEYAGAEAAYQRVIGLIEASGRLTSPRLARAYAGLATTYHAARRHDLAAPAFERAIALNRRAEGLFNEDQLALLGRQADSLTELGRTQDALLARRYALNVVARKHGERSLRFAAELESLGRWYTRVQAYEASRMTLRRAIELCEALDGRDSSDLIGPLTALADNASRWLLDPALREQTAAEEARRMMFQDPAVMPPPTLSASTVQSEGVKALERASLIADRHPEAPALAARVRTQLGDVYQARQQPDRALPQYRQAWAAAAGLGDEGAALRRTLFGEPVLLRYDAPDDWDRYAQRPPEEAERRYVEIELTVTAQGRVGDLRVVSDAGDERLATQARRAAQTAVYRPRFADGEPVEAAGVRFLQPFYVLLEPEPAPARPAQGGGGTASTATG